MVRTTTKSSQAPATESRPVTRQSRKDPQRTFHSDTEVMEGDQACATATFGAMSAMDADNRPCQDSLEPAASYAGSVTSLSVGVGMRPHSSNRHLDSADDSGGYMAHHSRPHLSLHDNSCGVFISKHSSGVYSLAPTNVEQRDFELPPTLQGARPRVSSQVQQPPAWLPETTSGHVTHANLTDIIRAERGATTQRDSGPHRDATQAPLLSAIGRYEATHPAPSPGSQTNPIEIVRVEQTPGYGRVDAPASEHSANRGDYYGQGGAQLRQRGRTQPSDNNLMDWT